MSRFVGILGVLLVVGGTLTYVFKFSDDPVSETWAPVVVAVGVVFMVTEVLTSGKRRR